MKKEGQNHFANPNVIIDLGFNHQQLPTSQKGDELDIKKLLVEENSNIYKAVLQNKRKKKS